MFTPNQVSVYRFAVTLAAIPKSLCRISGGTSGVGGLQSASNGGKVFLFPVIGTKHRNFFGAPINLPCRALSFFWNTISTKKKPDHTNTHFDGSANRQTWIFPAGGPPPPLPLGGGSSEWRFGCSCWQPQPVDPQGRYAKACGEPAANLPRPAPKRPQPGRGHGAVHRQPERPPRRGAAAAGRRRRGGFVAPSPQCMSSPPPSKAVQSSKGSKHGEELRINKMNTPPGLAQSRNTIVSFFFPCSIPI